MIWEIFFFFFGTRYYSKLWRDQHKLIVYLISIIHHLQPKTSTLTIKKKKWPKPIFGQNHALDQALNSSIDMFDLRTWKSLPSPSHESTYLIKIKQSTWTKSNNLKVFRKLGWPKWMNRTTEDHKILTPKPFECFIN